MKKNSFSIAFVAVLLATLFSALVIGPMPLLAGTTITIDGNFSDWSGVPAFGTDPNDAGGGSSDAKTIYVTSDGTNLYLRAEVWGTYSLSIVNILYIDTDHNVATGYNAGDWTAVGADYRIVHTTSGYPTPKLEAHTGGTGSDTWAAGVTISGAIGGGSAEYAVAYSAFSPALTPGTGIGVLYRASQDAAPDFRVAQPPAYIVEASGTPGATPTRTNTPTGPTNTPTSTPTRTNTPTGPTNTPTNTAPPTNTPTRTNTPSGPTSTPTNTASGGGGGPIVIDGNFSDWSGIAAMGTDPNDAGGGSSDARAVYLTSNGTNLYARAQVWGTYSLSVINIIYLDTDYNVATGYSPSWPAIGADYRLVHATAGFPSPTLQVHTGGSGSDSWSTVMTVSGAFSGDSGEYALPYSAFSPPLAGGGSVSALYRASQDGAPDFFGPKPPAHILQSPGPTPTPTRTATPCTSCPTPTRTSTPPGTGQKIAVPSYFYPCTGSPGCLWDQLNNGAPTVGVAIINPSSGPGGSKDQNYADQTTRSQAAGVKVTGYVHTSYGARAAATVKGEIDLFYTWYGVDGIFFDEVNNVCTTIAYYQDLYNYVKSKHATKNLVILNPGTNTDECYINAGDIIAIFESAYTAYLTWTPNAWVNNYPSNRFWHLVYGTTQANLPNAIQLSKNRRGGWVYITPDVLPNPWDSLPTGTYWTDELTLAANP